MELQSSSEHERDRQDTKCFIGVALSLFVTFLMESNAKPLYMVSIFHNRVTCSISCLISIKPPGSRMPFSELSFD